MQRQKAIASDRRPPICMDAIICTIQEMRNQGDDPNRDSRTKEYDLTVHPDEFYSGLHREAKWYPLQDGRFGYYATWGELRINAVLSSVEPKHWKDFE